MGADAELSKGQLVEMQNYFDKKFEEMKTWVKDNMVCAPHCVSRTNMEDLRHQELELKVKEHITDHQKTSGMVGKLLPYAWGMACAVCAGLYETLKH